jgi:hypothetical protein
MTSVQHNTIIYCTIHHKLCHHPPTTAWVLSTTMTASGWHVQHRTLLHNTVHYSSVCRLLVGGWRPDGCSLGPVSNSMSYRRRPAGEPHACRRRSNGGSLTEAAHTRQHIAPEQHSRIRAVLCMGAWTTQSDPSCVVQGCLDNTVGSELCCAWVLGQHSRIRAVLCMGAWTTQSDPSCVVHGCLDNTVGSELCCAWVLGQRSLVRAVLCPHAFNVQSTNRPHVCHHRLSSGRQ